MTQQCPICNSELEDNVARCPSCGYHISGSTQSFTPVFLRGEDKENTIDLDRRYELKIVRGPQTGIDIDLNEGISKVGRDPQCDIFLNDMTVSRSHALIDVSPKGCIIHDTNSFNGVWVNDRMVETCVLKPGDLIQIGAFCLMYRERPQ